MVRTVRAPLAVAATLTLLLGSNAGADAPGPPGGRLYSPTGPLNTRIPSNAKADESSAAMIALLRRDYNRGGFFLLLKRWTTTVFMANASTPRLTVRLTAPWAPARRMIGVPIPSDAVPDPSDDGSMAIIDRDTGCEYDFWQAKKGATGWSASWGNTIRISSRGVFPKGLSARGSGFALPAGVVWPSDVARGRIDHALIFSYSFPSAAGVVPPATESDGEITLAGAIPEGARLQLDPNLDLASLGLNRYERIIARALQEYGMYLADWGGPGITLYAVHPASFAGKAYAGLLPDKTYVRLDRIPVERFRVLAMPQPTPDDQLPKEIVPTGCAQLQ